MVHKVPPFSFRVGKTFVWDSNILAKNNILDFTSGTAFERSIYDACYRIGRKQRLYAIKTAEKSASKNRAIKILMLYMPQIKRRPARRRNRFYKLRNYLVRNRGNAFISLYFFKMRKRMAGFKNKLRFKLHLNRWLTKRMFRGSKIWHKIVDMHRFFQKVTTIFRFPLFYFTKLFFNSINFPTSEKVLSRFKRQGGIALLNFIQKKFRRVSKPLHMRRKWRKKASEQHRRRVLNTTKFSEKLSKFTKSRVKVKAFNLFLYLNVKGKMKYRTHQAHFWNKRYRYQRFFYAHYYDIINAFLVIGLFDNLRILWELMKVTIPFLTKVKRFLFFLNNVTKAMRCIAQKFNCFRIRITGKLGGGTKRTKTFLLGYGTIPYMSIQKKVRAMFISYRHKHGAFGVKFIFGYK